MSITFIDKDGKKIEYFLEPLGVREDGSSKTWQAFAEGSITEITAKDLKGLTKIRDGLFTNCDKLATVSIPTNITEIGDNVFKNCDSLTDVLYEGTKEEWESIVIGSDNEVVTDSSYIYSETEPTKPGNYWHYDENGEKVVWEPFYSKGLEYAIHGSWCGVKGVGTCTDTDIVIPSTHEGLPVLKISSGAFRWNRSITSVYIPDSVTFIESTAFYYCESLTSVRIPDCVSTIGDQAFEGCTKLHSVNIPSRITFISKQAFRSCITLTNIVIPDGVRTIGNQAFAGCRNLTSVYIPDSVTSIEKQSFEGCTGVTSLTIGNSVTTVGDYAFYGLSSLTSLTIPDSVTSIGASAFSGLANLSSIHVGSNNEMYTIIGEGLYTKDGTGLLLYPAKGSLSTLHIPNTVTFIANNAFRGCTSLVSIDIPDSVMSIGESAFFDCDNITSITIPNSVTQLGDHVLRSCDELTTVIMGNGVSSIDSYVFYTSRNLNTIDFSSYKTVPTLKGSSAFGGLPSSLKIIVPAALYDEWIAATNWSNLASKIVKAEPQGSEGLEYTLNSDNASYSVSAIGTCTDTDIVIPEMYEGLPVTVLNPRRFYYNSTITSFTLPDSIVEIVERFDTMRNLRKITIGKGVNKLYRQFAFDCSSLNEIVVSDDNASLKSVNGNLYNKDGTTLIQYATGKTDTVFVIPNGVVQISLGAFATCKTLEEIILSNSLSQIGESAFYGCSSLRTIEIPNSVTTIDKATFSGCSSLTRLVIPNSVTSIGNTAFSGCEKILEYDFSSYTSVPTLGSNAFQNTNTNAKIIVPDALYDQWIAATNWSNMASYIVKASEYVA